MFCFQVSRPPSSLKKSSISKRQPFTVYINVQLHVYVDRRYGMLRSIYVVVTEYIAFLTLSLDVPVYIERRWETLRPTHRIEDRVRDDVDVRPVGHEESV